MLTNASKKAFFLPSALSTEFLSLLKNTRKEVVLFLDYDGTLTPIVDRPEMAVLSNEAREAINNLSHYFRIAVVSGRTRTDVQDRVGLPHLFYAGSHGFDISGPVKHIRHDRAGLVVQTLLTQDCSSQWTTQKRDDGTDVVTFQVAKECIPVLRRIYETLKESLSDIEGCILENNIFSLSVHYRLIKDERDVQRVSEIVEGICKDESQVVHTHGKMVHEIRINTDWNKGKAVQFLLNFWNVGSSDKVLSVYIGDDKTDEDAFKVLKDHDLGVGVLVSPTNVERFEAVLTQDDSASVPSVPGDGTIAAAPNANPQFLTYAKYHLKDPKMVVEFLQTLLKEWKE
ncbi:hypothetical protein C9374_007386 [Naegleria lovaniensis]|uniref:Trehalose 6-phosphate phosphatase n=1 Tax=Naegleria lovaniensis TaxID=51637 RepID=A0AA88GKU9_NAELO|nr:uncharacterized protein C9374_007386 [Naegleria lovaniensis]KAG2379247.1 hypothetical protein C9374_007386 [Naegleria lovaniensis]